MADLLIFFICNWENTETANKRKEKMQTDTEQRRRQAAHSES